MSGFASCVDRTIRHGHDPTTHHGDGAMQRYRANEPNVAHERLDDEVVAIHLRTGVYYALSGVSADIWTLVAAGTDVETTADHVASRYEVGTDTARMHTAQLVHDLVSEDLLVLDGDAPVEPPVLPDRRSDYAPPELQRYDDMQNLLLIDPIHQVDDTGWPARPGEVP